MFNLVVLTGRLTADPELKYTTNNTPVANFTIAVDRRYKQGEEKQADFINIVAWRQTAEFISKYFQKGSMIGIEGSIQTRKYVDKDTGKNRTAFEVIANNAQFVEGKKDNTSPDQDTNAPHSASFATPADDSGFTDVDPGDDLPF